MVQQLISSVSGTFFNTQKTICTTMAIFKPTVIKLLHAPFEGILAEIWLEMNVLTQSTIPTSFCVAPKLQTSAHTTHNLLPMLDLPKYHRLLLCSYLRRTRQKIANHNFNQAYFNVHIPLPPLLSRYLTITAHLLCLICPKMILNYRNPSFCIQLMIWKPSFFVQSTYQNKLNMDIGYESDIPEDQLSVAIQLRVEIILGQVQHGY